MIITGGPGTGKTTIIKAITELYQHVNKLDYDEFTEHLALLAPTGRASKRMSESTFLPASTIHRFLKWNKETLEFMVNEENKSDVDLVIVDEEQNKSIKPSEILFKSRQRVNWKCHHCGNRWNISVYSRTHNKSGCPECAKKIRAYNRNLKNLANRGSLADNSKLLSEWNYEKNLGLNPHDFTPKSNQYVWWKCTHCGYEWKAKISNRAFGRNCPCCSNKVRRSPGSPPSSRCPAPFR